MMAKFVAIWIHILPFTQALSSVSTASSLQHLLHVATETISSSISTTSETNGRVCGGRMEILRGLFREEPLLIDRDVTVWLPPEYDDDDSTQRYPVLYCHDGQNAIADDQSWTGASWRLAHTLVRLGNNDRIHMPIVVLIPSAAGDVLLPGIRRRHLEYASLQQSPLALAHARIVANVIKPMVDRQFRTLCTSEHTFAMGSSLGGQASMNLLLQYPQLFGGAACLSPYFSADTIASVKHSLLPSKKRIYLDIGGDSADVKVRLFELQDHLTKAHWWNPGYFWLDTSLQASVQRMRSALHDHTDVQYRYIPGARHNERAWAERMQWPILHLLGK